MKSNKQRRAEIKRKRLARAAQQTRHQATGLDARRLCVAGVVVADTALLARLNNSYGLPSLYVDRAFQCRDCGAEEVWTAQQQKWWYEEMQANICSRAVRCLRCRRACRARRAQALAVPGAHRLGRETEALRALGEAPANAASRAQVATALQSKWWSLRVVAIQVLGRWGTTDDVQQLQAFVAARPVGGHRGWAREAAAAATRALAQPSC